MSKQIGYTPPSYRTYRRKELQLRRLTEEIAQITYDRANLSRAYDALASRTRRLEAERSLYYDTAGKLASAEVRLRKLKNDRDGLQRKLKRITNPPLSKMQKQLVEASIEIFPKQLHEPVREIVTDSVMRETLMALADRGDWTSLEKLLLQGIGMNPLARRHLDSQIDKLWDRGDFRKSLAEICTPGPPLVVGGGLHAAIFCAVYHAQTGQKPLVLERDKSPGGIFNVSKGPSFYLNSRNRPGPLSVPGDEYGSLNVLPGSIIQPSDMGGGDYLTNDSVAWVVRTMLLMHADVMAGISLSTVEAFSQTSNRIQGAYNVPRRVVTATGLSVPGKAFEVDSPRYLTFSEFMARMDTPFPLKDMKRVAVLGAGDSGKTAIEALTGQGPSTAFSVQSLDYVEKIDWYGVPPDRTTRENWETCSRSRYKQIGRLLPREAGGRAFRVLPLARAGYLDRGFECLKLDGMPYDYVIDCTGFRPSDVVPGDMFSSGGQPLGKRSTGWWAVGPVTDLPEERADTIVLQGVVENRAAIFRYADRTARVAEIMAAL